MPPVVALAQRARRGHDHATIGFLALLFAVAAFALAVPANRAVADLAMRRFHLALPFPVWALLQPVPAMYNFENRFWLAAAPLSAAERVVPPPPGVVSFAVNHYPTRILTFGPGRAEVLRRPAPAYIYFESRYRGRRVESAHALVPSSPVRGEVFSTRAVSIEVVR
jgi:hypothetical protein